MSGAEGQFNSAMVGGKQRGKDVISERNGRHATQQGWHAYVTQGLWRHAEGAWQMCSEISRWMDC
jgi:hypothetical protein